jgi:hypothetical protein
MLEKSGVRATPVLVLELPSRDAEVSTVTVATFCKSGEAERVKGSVHAAAGAIVGLMAVYNAVAWWHRRERHLGVNAIVYAAGFALEAYQTRRHFVRQDEEAIPAAQEIDACGCGDGFCWCGSAESKVVRFANTGS